MYKVKHDVRIRYLFCFWIQKKRLCYWTPDYYDLVFVPIGDAIILDMPELNAKYFIKTNKTKWHRNNNSNKPEMTARKKKKPKLEDKLIYT